MHVPPSCSHMNRCRSVVSCSSAWHTTLPCAVSSLCALLHALGGRGRCRLSSVLLQVGRQPQQLQLLHALLVPAGACSTSTSCSGLPACSCRMANAPAPAPEDPLLHLSQPQSLILREPVRRRACGLLVLLVLLVKLRTGAMVHHLRASALESLAGARAATAGHVGHWHAGPQGPLCGLVTCGPEHRAVPTLHWRLNLCCAPTERASSRQCKLTCT